MLGRLTDDRGYTLAEMLAALMIVGLTLGGMAGGVMAVARLQKQGAARASSAERTAALTNGLERLMRVEGPFSSSGGIKLVGDRAGFRFECAKGLWCGAALNQTARGASLRLTAPAQAQTLALPDRSKPSFEYIGSKSAGDHWPPDNPTDWQKLKAIELLGSDEGAPVASVRLWIDAGSAGPIEAAPFAGGSP